MLWLTFSGRTTYVQYKFTWFQRCSSNWGSTALCTKRTWQPPLQKRSFGHLRPAKISIWPRGFIYIYIYFFFFSCSTQLNTKYFLLINLKMQTAVGIFILLAEKFPSSAISKKELLVIWDLLAGRISCSDSTELSIKKSFETLGPACVCL